MEYRKNKVVEKLKRDEPVLCTKINISSGIPVSIAALCGVDCIWVDMEHVASDYSQIQQCILAARAYGAEIIVRTPRGAYSNLVRPLELDASGVMVPHVMNCRDAKQVVYYTKFHPVGRRPIDGGNADGLYCLLDTQQYLRCSNEEKLTIIQIEDVEAMEELEEIASLPGIDMLFFGPADFSQSTGDPAHIWNSRTLEARRLVAEAARRHGKFAGTVGSTENFRELCALGYRFISIGADVTTLGEYYKKIVSDVRAEIASL